MTPPQLVSSGSRVVEVGFKLAGSTTVYPFEIISDEANCRVELQKMLPRGEDVYAEYFSVEGADPNWAVKRAKAFDIDDAWVLSEHETGGLVEFVVGGVCPAKDLAELGGIPREVVAEDGGGRIVAEIRGDHDPGAIIDAFLESHPHMELSAKREMSASTPLFTIEELQQAVDARLTVRQEEVLKAAYEAGYYERPRTQNGRAIADDLGISQPTFSQHLRAAEKKLLSILYEQDREVARG